MKYFFNNKYTLHLIIFLLVSSSIYSQVNEKDLKQHVIYLSSDKFEGRSLNSSGIRYAEQYILTIINELKLHPIDESYRQEFSITNYQASEPLKPSLSFKQTTYYNPMDFITVGTNTTDKCEYPVYTLNYINNKHPKEDFAILLNNKSEINTLKDSTIQLILIPTQSEEEYKAIADCNSKGIFTTKSSSNFIIEQINQLYYLDPELSKNISSLLKTKHKLYITTPCRNSDIIKNNTANLYGMILGSSQDSTIIISAHYDHIGIRNGKINPGANDNASGVSAVLEIAKSLALNNRKPKYNIVFVFFSAEESGLLGSKFFMNNCPFKKESIIANINLDMIGNKDDYHKDEPNFIYAYGPENSQHLIYKIDSLNNLKSYLKLDFYDHDLETGQRFLNMSDQASFLSENIPVLFIFNGLSPNYHKPDDTYDKLDYSKMKNVCNLTIDLITQLAY